jgi:hypothetical protein
VPARQSRDRQLQEDDGKRVDEEQLTDPALADPGLVLGVGRQHLELCHPGGDEQRIHQHQTHEDAVAEHVEVAPRTLGTRGRPLRRRHEYPEHSRITHERERVEEEERAEALGGDQAACQPADPDPEVHRHALHREHRGPLLARREPGEERRLRRPERAVADPDDRRSEESLPGGLDERVAADPEQQKAEGDREHPLPSDAVDERSGDRAGDEADGGVRRQHEPGGAEIDPALVVQVDEGEREHEPVPERVQEPAQLQGLDRPRQLRVEAAQVTLHRGTVAPSVFQTTLNSCSIRTWCS